MKRLSVFYVLLIAAYSTPLAPLVAQQQSIPSETQQIQITIINNTGFPIWYVYISPSTDYDWGPDLLNDDQIISDEESVTLSLPNHGAEQYDIMLEGSVGDIYIKYNEKVTNGIKVIFTFDDIDIWRYLQ